ncbi:hypothetical protein [Aurantimonas sp. HBX-1]|uniref:hypothetical protein n=1 Tax=Aurantimonas sp. HBX-1 TaxID=2906072 RepID=UPI001F178FB4|nr:hypothetical protein [Aurantimonas sp. HBX-1]UIJ73945.1 hypothetical protein LXB15_10190 [Aurantimonas sp. HBX-1]
MKLTLVPLAALLAMTASAEARSRAAEYLVAEQIAEACDGGRGTIEPSGVIERDLTGDGAADLIIAHEAITCAGGGVSGRSLFCGMQVCSVHFYVRRGTLLQPVLEMLGGGVTAGPGDVPDISMYAHGGTQGSVRWNGRTFD